MFVTGRAAWERVKTAGIAPGLVFTHPTLLQAHIPRCPNTIPRCPNTIAGWFYNAVLSSIIENSSDWTLKNGYRNIVITMGIRLDGMFRSKIGQMVEDLVKSRILDWLRTRALAQNSDSSGVLIGISYRRRALAEVHCSL